MTDDDLDRLTAAPEGPHPDEEAPAELREAARHLRGMYVAMRQQRFTEAQTVAIIGTWLGTQAKGNGQ